MAAVVLSKNTTSLNDNKTRWGSTSKEIHLSNFWTIERFLLECLLLWFNITKPKLAPLFHPIRNKTRTNRDSIAHVFPPFASATCISLQFWLVHCIMCPLWLASVITRNIRAFARQLVDSSTSCAKSSCEWMFGWLYFSTMYLRHKQHTYA